MQEVLFLMKQEVVCQADSPQDTKAYVYCRHTLQIKLPKNRYPGAVNHGTHAPEKQISLYWLFICLQGKHTEKAGGFFCCWFVLKSKVKTSENDIYKQVDMYYFGCLPLDRWRPVFSLRNHPSHMLLHMSRCPRRLDTNRVNVFHPFGDSDLSQDEQITNQEHQLHPELLRSEWILDSVGPSMVKLWPLSGRATTWSPGLKCSWCGTKTAEKFKFWATTPVPEANTAPVFSVKDPSTSCFSL